MACKNLRIEFQDGESAVGVSANRPGRIAMYAAKGARTNGYFCQALACFATEASDAVLTANDVKNICQNNWRTCKHYS